MKRIIILTILTLPVVSFLMHSITKKINSSLIFNPAIELESSFDDNQNLAKVDSKDEIMLLANSELPVGESVIIETESESNGLAVFIPQTHINPGTNYNDSINDSAVIAQEEIYNIMDTLVEKKGVNFIMIEGEQYGEIISEKKDTVKTLLAINDSLSKNTEQLKTILKEEGVEADKIDNSTKGIDNTLTEIDRRIYLSGAAYKISAEHDNVAMYGAENQDTYAECSTVIKNYIYQKDRIAACNSESGNTGNIAKSNNVKSYIDKLKSSLLGGNDNPDKLSELKNSILDRSIKLDSLFLGQPELDTLIDLSKIMEYLSNKNSAAESLATLDRYAAEKNNSELTNIISEIKKDIENYKNIDNNTTNTTTEKRSDNPYSHIDDTDELGNMLEESETKIQELVIDKRNVETAENFKNALENTGNNIGILQFGAGHEEGLIEELTKQNITVLVLKPNEVHRREMQKTNTND